MVPRRFRPRLATAALLIAAACDATPKSSSDVVWDKLPSGALHAVYSSLPVLPLTTTATLRIGGLGAEGPAAFGGVRGIDVDRAGRILVLDGQANELRAFDTTGAPADVVMKKGEGPGEIRSANGFRLDTLGAIWVNDHGRWKVTRLKDGEFTTYPMPVLSYGYLWDGGVTLDGHIWEFQRGPLEGEAAPPFDPNAPTAVRKTVARLMLKSLDPASRTVESARMGTQTLQALTTGMGVTSIPFVATPLVAFDPAGAVWMASSDVDQLVKISGKGDTLLIVELPGVGPDATPTERTAEIDKAKSVFRRQGGASESIDWESIVPKRKPVLASLSVDDRSRLWAQRRTASGPVFDVLSPTGQLLGSIDPDFEPYAYFPPVIRGKSIYAVVTDSLDVPTVIRAPVPLP